MNEEIKRLLVDKKKRYDGHGRERSDRDLMEWIGDAVEILLRAELERKHG